MCQVWLFSFNIYLDKGLHSVIVFQIYYLYINIDALSQCIRTSVACHYTDLVKSYIILYLKIPLLNQLIELIKRADTKW